MVFLSGCEIKASKELVAGQDIVFQVRNRKVDLPTQLYIFSSGKMLQSKKCSSQKSYMYVGSKRYPTSIGGAKMIAETFTANDASDCETFLFQGKDKRTPTS